MSYSNIKKTFAGALLLAFLSPSTFAVTDTKSQVASSVQSMEAMSLNGNVQLTNKNEVITLSLRDSDVRQVLRMFADKAGLNIVFHNSVTGKVTLDLVNTSINNAFGLVLNVAGLNYYKQGATLIIMSKDSPDNAAYSKQEMMIFPVNYVSADRIADFLNKNVFGLKKPGMSSVDAATVNSATNELIVFGMPSDEAIVRKVIAQFDREPYSKTFAVNHTTPEEMAKMICELLLPSRGIGKNGSLSGSSTSSNAESGGMTGGAASAGSSSSSSSSSGSSSDGDIKLGEGIIACSVASSVANNSAVSPFDIQNLSVAYFPQRGTITVMGGSESQARMIENFIKSNDVKQPQAYLEVQIVELNEDGSKEFSNNWAFSTKSWGFNFNGTSTSGGRPGGMFDNMVNATEYHYEPGARSADGEWHAPVFSETPIKLVAPATTYISWTMNYIINNKKGRVLANPKILITNGKESIIDLTQDYVEKVTSEFLSSANNGSVTTGAVERTYTIGDDLGIKVNLTPFISPDGYVTLNVKPEYSTVASQVYGSSATGQNDLVATLLSRRNLDLKNVRIRDGETLVIGGLIQEYEMKNVSKIPVLGDLPVIGAAFRSTSTQKTKSELVIMLTPKIIEDDDIAHSNNNV